MVIGMNDKHLTDEELRRIEELARVRLTGDSREKLRGQLAGIIDFVRRLGDIDRAEAESTPADGSRGGTGRRDVVEDCLSKKEVLDQAPESERGMFRVPPVIETDGT
jgi:aspartyl-tRNA(Asn)/glutamyl-tRNA(Gln) amidotransferase subunit C